MRRGSFGTLLVATLAVTFLVNPSAAPPSGRSTTQGIVQQRLGKEHHELKNDLSVDCPQKADLLCVACPAFCPSKGLRDTIGEFFGPQDKKEAAGKEGARWGVPDDVWASLSFVIAIVPDPVHTHLSLDFDREIDAIQEAVQQGGYLFARAYTPWDPSDHPEDTQFHVRLQQQAWEASKEEIPGLMIFRKATPNPTSLHNGPMQDSLFVFLVGDSPTGGISKIQFHNAVQIIGQIRKTSKQESLPESLPKPLKIFGPSFSGSLYSLMDILAGDLASVRVQVYSGQVSSFDTKNWFNNFRKGPTSAPLLSFEESDRFITTRLIAFLEKAHYEAKDIAILSEDQTAYGSQVTSGTSSVPQTRDESVVPRFYFPREISQLRTAYQKDAREGESPAGANRPSSRLTLPLNLSDERNDEDDVASYSKGQTPLSQQGVLLGIVADLQKHHSKFILIQASDALDEIFLTNFLRTAYPNGRIITTGADLLFQRDLEDPRLRGVLAVSSYSLAPGSDDHIARSSLCPLEEHVDRVFPTSFSVGSYNAMLSLLKFGASSDVHTASGIAGEASGACAKSDSGKLPAAAYAGYGWPCAAGQAADGEQLVAPLWLSLIGRGGYWPVEILSKSIYADAGKGIPTSLVAVSGDPHSDCGKRTLPLPWILLFVACLLLEVVYLYFLRTGSILSRSDFSATFAPISEGTDPPDSSVPAAPASEKDMAREFGFRNWVFFMANTLFLLILMMLAWPLMRWACSIASFPLWFCLELLGFGLLMICGFWELQIRKGKWLPRTFVLSCIFAPIITFWLARGSLGSGLESFGNFTTYRYIHVTSGVSPVVPWLFLAAAGLWWAWHTLTGMALSDKRQPCLPRTSANARLRRLGCEYYKTLRDVMHPAKWDPRVYVPTVLIAILPIVAMFDMHPVEALEGPANEIAYSIVLGLAVFTLLSGVTRLCVIWTEFRPLLTALESKPLRRAFDRLHGFKWKPIWRFSGLGLRHSYRLVSREFESLEHCRNYGIGDDAVMKGISKAFEMRDGLSKGVQEGQKKEGNDSEGSREERPRRAPGFLGAQPPFVDGVVRDFQAVQHQLAKICSAALEYLQAMWDEETTVDLFEVSPPRENGHSAEPEESQEIQLLEQFVSLFYLNFILSVLMRMRALIISAAGMLVFILLSFNSYPFQPKALLDKVFLFFFLIVVALVVRVLAQMHRDATLSRITDTTPGELGFDFWFRLASFVGVPLVGLLATQFPSIGGFLYSWFTPAAQAFK